MCTMSCVSWLRNNRSSPGLITVGRSSARSTFSSGKITLSSSINLQRTSYIFLPLADRSYLVLMKQTASKGQTYCASSDDGSKHLSLQTIAEPNASNRRAMPLHVWKYGGENGGHQLACLEVLDNHVQLEGQPTILQERINFFQIVHFHTMPFSIDHWTV